MSVTGSSLTGFEPVAEVTADDRARITLSKVGVHATDRFLMSTKATGEILLTPIASIPKRELIVWENEGLRASLQLGIAQAEAGLIAADPGAINRLEAL